MKNIKRKKTLITVLLFLLVAVVLSIVVVFVVSAANRKNALDYTARDIGETIIFGEYNINKDKNNKKEEMEWVIIDKKDDKILVVSKYAVDERVYHNKGVDVDWSDCSLRAWLNKDFYNDCFSDEEKGKIIEANLINNDYKVEDIQTQKWKDGGISTKDHVFILSVREAEKYFPVLEQNRMKIPLRCYVGGTYSSPEYGWSWLRDPGTNSDSAAYFADGFRGVVFVGDNGKGVKDPTVLVRPAMWISLG